MNEPLAELNAAHAALKAWIERSRNSPDPATEAKTSLKRVAMELLRAERAIAAMRSEDAHGAELRGETEEYRGTLAAMRAQIEHIEVILRMRAAKIKKRQAKIEALRSWAGLARNIHSLKSI